MFGRGYCFGWLALVGLAASLVGSEALGQVGAQAGVVVDADGVLQTRVFPDPTGQLTRRRFAEAKGVLDPQVARRSPLRKVSLNRLEAAVAQRIAQGAGPSHDMQYLAGLTRIRYVFFYPETRDIVIAGPAEGYAQDLSGRAVGIESGQAVLELQDLIVALRAYPASGERTRLIGCSIDPTQEGLARMQQFLVRIGGRATPADTGRIVDGLRESLGLQTVSINGISPRTHFAQVLVEADYRMKLIGIGLEQPPVKIPSYVSRANPRNVSRNALQRWYFTPNYECVRVSEDGMSMELVGEGVKLIGEDELVTADGRRQQAGGGDRASQAFVQAFTNKYPELAKKSPVYGQLRNLIDLVIATAYIQQQDYYRQADWNMELFGDEDRLPVETYQPPQQVPTAVNAIWKGNTLMTPVGGGVNIQPQQALATDRMLWDQDGQLQQLHGQVHRDDLADDQWWWD